MNERRRELDESVRGQVEAIEASITALFWGPAPGWPRGLRILRANMAELGAMIGDPLMRDSVGRTLKRIEGTIRTLRRYGTRQEVEAASAARAELVRALHAAIRGSTGGGS